MINFQMALIAVLLIIATAQRPHGGRGYVEIHYVDVIPAAHGGSGSAQGSDTASSGGTEDFTSLQRSGGAFSFSADAETAGTGIAGSGSAGFNGGSGIGPSVEGHQP